MKTRRQAVLAACLIAAGAAALSGDQGGSGNQSKETRLRTSLAGAPIQGKVAEGHADFRTDRGRVRLNVEVEDVNLPAGTVLTVSVVEGSAMTVIGAIKLSAAGAGELELNSQDGDVVPPSTKGDMVTVSAGNTRILAGVF